MSVLALAQLYASPDSPGKQASLERIAADAAGGDEGARAVLEIPVQMAHSHLKHARRYSRCTEDPCRKFRLALAAARKAAGGGA